MKAATISEGSITKTKVWKTPDTMIIIFFVALFAAVLSWVVPAGSFQTQDITYLAEGVEKSRTVIEPGSFEIARDAAGDVIYNRAELFESGGGAGFLNFVFEGLVSGSKWGSAIGVIMFMLVIGGAFGIIMRTGTIDNGILKLIDKTRGNEILFIPVMFFLFSLGGAVFGMGEEAIAFAIIIAPLMVKLGYDGITAVMVTYVATQIGFGSSWMNPFSVAIAQGIAGVPVMSGSVPRMVMWALFTLVGIVFTMSYASKIKKDPTLSHCYATDAYFRTGDDAAAESTEVRFNLGDWLILTTIVASLIWVIWGVVIHEWYIPEIASQFFTMGLVAGIIGVVFRLNDMTVNDIAAGFKEGAGSLLPAAIIVGMAKGIMLLLGGVGADTPTALNTILNAASGLIGSLPEIISAWLMLVFQAVFNFFVTSGTGQAALTMPLMAPLADLVGVSRQVSVLSFQLGDGFTNILVPTSASLMGTLGVCRVDWGDWAKFIWKFVGLLFAISSVLVIGAQMVGFS